MKKSFLFCFFCCTNKGGGGNRQQDAVCCTHKHTHTYIWEKFAFYLLASSKASYKRPRKTEAAVAVDAARSRIWEISRKSYENWLAKVAQRSCVCVCVCQIVQIYALYTHTYTHICIEMCVCVCARQKLSWSRGEARRVWSRCWQRERRAEAAEQREEKEEGRAEEREESGESGKSGLGLWSRECSRY